MNRAMLEFLRTESNNLEQAGLLRRELVLDVPGGATVRVGKKQLLNLCSSDALGLAQHPEVKKAAKEAVEALGVGTGSSRMVAGTLALHRELEKAVTELLGTEDTLVFPSGYHAATGAFESLLSEKDYLVCDAQVQPAVADGIKLCRARVLQYRSRDPEDLEDRLRRSRAARFRMVVTDGVFPLEGSTAPLQAVCAIADRYEAMVVVEDSQGVGVLGAKGAGTAELLGVTPQVDLLIGGFGQALGVGEGGYASGRKELVSWLRQKSRPHLLCNALSPAAAASALRAIQLVRASGDLREQLRARARGLRDALVGEGFKVIDSEHPTLSVVLGDAVGTQRMADLLFRKGVFAMGFCHPVVPEGAARIRVQVTLQHPEKDLLVAAETFGAVARELKLLPARR